MGHHQRTHTTVTKYQGPDLQNIVRFIVRYIVRLTYDSDLRHAKIYLTIIDYRELIYEHYLRRSYDFVSESYPRKGRPITCSHSRRVHGVLVLVSNKHGRH